ncbi:GNAT family N-acetyltransferase [Sphingomonas sp. 2R-10]|uniref:GNAT family N-acetyltransferase n=1 Tax=Sphingomonas sp. 2R-10 TaxID=3045148 RepID=UPI0024B9E5A0|nr:GNAT family N-acetyltransferase [Sphingomonas sp. 2R-10]MDJ0276060.1 GNAT family N-acetyltransferase [Sphingomonas sp. 2R-10]
MSGVGSSGGTYRVEVVREGTEIIARDILDSLPEWFGRPESLDEYVAATTRMPTLVAYSKNGKAAGFLSLEKHTSVAAEIHVIGVARDQRGRGCGRKLIEQAETMLRAEGVRWLTVKTLAACHPDPHYAETRLFYEASGFEPLEVFSDLWGEDTPCLMMMRPIG